MLPVGFGIIVSYIGITAQLCFSTNITHADNYPFVISGCDNLMCMYIKNVHCISYHVSACSSDNSQLLSFSCLRSPSVIDFTLLFTTILLCYLELQLQTLSWVSASMILFCLFHKRLSSFHCTLTSNALSFCYQISLNFSNLGFIQQLTFTPLAPF